MATPYSGTTGGTKDAYNFYHLQLQIRIECAFGILSKRWAILRSAIPVNIRIKKAVALVVALAKLHYFCINARDTNVSANTAHDAVPLVPVEGCDQGSESRLSSLVPQQLLHGGEHFDDIERPGICRRERSYRHVLLPRATTFVHCIYWYHKTQCTICRRLMK
jgi:hypothetical protein